MSNTYNDPNNPNSTTTTGLKRRWVGSAAFDPKNLPEALKGDAQPVEKPKTDGKKNK